MKLRTHNFIDEHLPDAWLYDDSILYIDQDERTTIVKGFAVYGQPMSNLSVEHLANWRVSAMTMLNSLEISAHLHFFWTVENNYSHFLEGHQKERDTSSTIAHHLLQERIAEYEKKQLANELYYRKLFVFVNFEPAPSRLRADEELKRRLQASRDHRMLLTEWRAARQKLEQLIEMARHPFESCGMNTSLLTSKDHRRLFRGVLSPLHSRLRIQPPESNPQSHLWTDTAHSDFERKPPFLFFDDHFHAFVSMSNLPQETRTGFLQHLFDFSHPDYTLSVTLRTTDKQEEIKSLQSDYGSKLGLQRARQQSGKIANVEMETQAEEIRDEIRTLTQTPQQIIHAQLLIHLWHPDENELRRRIDEAMLKIGYCNGTQATLERIAAPEALRACLPGWTRESRLDRFQVVKSVNAADFIPAHTDFVGTGKPQLLFPTPQGGLMTSHVFTSARPFHNVIVGETGGGKTFLINSIVTQLVSQGLKSVSVISTKDELGPLMSIFEGEKISFSENNPTFLQLCMIAGDEPTLDELSSMTAILETIFGDEPNDGERKVRLSRILKAARLVYQKFGPKTRLRDFVGRFREGWDHDNRDELRRLAIILEPYANGGLYGEFFDSDTRKPIDLSNNFKFFDFSGIQKNKNLSAVMMMALTTGEAIRLAGLPRHHRKALILDECWAFVDNSAGGDFIENALRIYRAFNCSVFLSTQIITDFLSSRIAPVIMGNCHNFYLLRTKDHTAISILQKELHLTLEICQRFAMMPDPADVGYSHFVYVHRAERSNIAGEGINRVSKPEALLYSTSPNVSQLRDHVLKTASDPWEAVNQLAKLSSEEIKQRSQELFESTL
jgi:hypothetical protein